MKPCNNSFMFDINSDLGEWYGKRNLEVERRIMPFLTSCNVACGFHSGDPYTIEQTIEIALKHHVKIGAHPSFPDLIGFGRRTMELPVDELKAIVRYQVAALKGMVESLGGVLHHVKAHGALYNSAMKRLDYSNAICEAAKSLDENLVIYGLPNSRMQAAAEQLNLKFWAEGFADRRYEDDLTLRSRKLEGAVLHDLESISKQIHHFKNHQVETYQGNIKSLNIQTVCIHSDTQNAIKIAERVNSILQG
jgi:UPF0271 protein